MSDYIGKRLGNYQLTRLLGVGGFAQVYLGEHIYLGTQAAIKVLSTQQVNDLDWFRIEARTIARLIHPNIVRILEFGVEDTIPFLVQDYAPRGTLRQLHPRGTSVPLAAVNTYVKQVAEALQYAHDEKLVHRDVKPENMLLGRNSEVLLSDFGIAQVSQTVGNQSLQNVAGTLVYMAPEQIQGQPRRASDQYSLGIIVYEWLTGARPFDGSLTEIISQQLVAVPLPLRTRKPDISPAVEQVVMMALAKNPEQRFGSIRAFANALEQASQSSAPVSIVGKPVEPVHSEKAPAALSSSSISAGTLVSTYRGHANTIRSLSWSPDSARLVSTSNDQIVHIWDAKLGTTYQTYQDRSGAVRMIAGSPDGLRLATAGADSLIRIWEVATNRLLMTYAGHVEKTINAITWAPEQPILASAATDGTVHVWDTTTGQPLTIYRGHTGSVNALAWSREMFPAEPGRGYCLVSGSDDTSMQIWEAFTGKTMARYRNQSAKVQTVAWSPTVYAISSNFNSAPGIPRSSRIAGGMADGLIQMWDTTANREVLSYRYAAPISVVAWSPDGRRFAYASQNHMIEIWDTRTNSKLLTFSHRAPLHAMAWSPDGKYIASGGEDRIIQVWVAP